MPRRFRGGWRRTTALRTRACEAMGAPPRAPRRPRHFADLRSLLLARPDAELLHPAAQRARVYVEQARRAAGTVHPPVRASEDREDVIPLDQRSGKCDICPCSTPSQGVPASRMSMLGRKAPRPQSARVRKRLRSSDSSETKAYCARRAEARCCTSEAKNCSPVSDSTPSTIARRATSSGSFCLSCWSLTWPSSSIGYHLAAGPVEGDRGARNETAPGGIEAAGRDVYTALHSCPTRREEGPRRARLDARPLLRGS